MENISNSGPVPEFKSRSRYAQNIQREWRLASVEEVRRNLGTIKEKRILGSWDIARLLDGWVDGPGYRYTVRNEYRPSIGHMLLVKTPVRRPDDGSFDPEVYSGVKLNAEGREAALLFSCEDKITEVLCFVLQSIVESFDQAGEERQAELDRLNKSLQQTFRNGRTVLHYAADQTLKPRHAQYVARLLLHNFEYGKELSKDVDKYGRTALHLASLHGHIDLCKFFMVKCEMKPSDRDRMGENLLHFAVNSKSLDLVEYLWMDSEVKGLVGSHDAKGKTPLHKAAAGGDGQMTKFLVSKIKEDSLEKYIGYISQADFLGQTALHEAAIGGHENVVKYLLEVGSRPLAERNSEGKTALHYAVQLSDQEIAKRLVQTMLRSCKSDEERSLLLWASATGIGSAEESAISQSAVQTYLKEERERTAESSKDLLRSAIKLGYDNLAWELINRGANTQSITNLSGNDWSPDERQRVHKFLGRVDKMPERGRDQPTIDDSLGRKGFAEGLAALFLNPYVKTPVTVGISGDWGMGKSSLMLQTEMVLLKTAAQLAFPNLLQTEKFPGCKQFKLSGQGRRKYQQIEKAVIELLRRSPLTDGDDPLNLVHFLDNYQHKYNEVYRSLAVMDRSEMFHVKDDTSNLRRNPHSLGKIPSVLTIRYNAWHYQNELEAWAGLAVQITKAIEGTMNRAQRIRCRCRYAWKEHLKEIWLELFLPCLLVLLLFGWVAWVAWMLLSRSSHKELARLKYGSIPITVVIVVWTVVRQLLSVIKPISDQIEGYVSLPDHRKNLGYQHQVISDIKFLEDQMGEKPSWLWKLIAFEWLWRLFCLYPDTVEGTSIPKSPPPSKDDVRIIVFVDDLDRCQDTVILQVLSAVNLVLAVCEINVILGMDKKMIARAIANKFQDSNNPQIIDPVDLADKYISKIVQLPLALPDADDVETKLFLDQQLGVAFEGTGDENTDSIVSEQTSTAGNAGGSNFVPDSTRHHVTADAAPNSITRRNPDLWSKFSESFRKLKNRLRGFMSEQEERVGAGKFKKLDGNETNSNVPEQAQANVSEQARDTVSNVAEEDRMVESASDTQTLTGSKQLQFNAWVTNPFSSDSNCLNL
ncbi:hypothetical protein KI387_043970 [Taxus chinensis]|uniref:KAP NTPase domain-containing protein n=1 Tax=Taxus chinensis TaxID=29808 RepID=A0AA38LCZ6_TAXCH|nr:hypothetical protein KI387_043970 [Taxus chinensis]